MALLNSPSTYGSITKWLHWILAVCVIVMLILGALMGYAHGTFRSELYQIHKSLGLTVLFLFIARILWHRISPTPRLPSSLASWEKTLAKTVQVSLYVSLILMPLSGWAMSVASYRPPSFWGWFTLSLPIKPNPYFAEVLQQAHSIIAWVIIALLALHIAGAIKHQWVQHDDVLKRMLPCLP